MISTTFNILGSLGVFLFGMKVMSEGIQKTAGSRLRDILAYMTQNRFAGVFTGFLTTCLVQSSSATTVMTISFVNAGLLTLVQSIGIIMGANIGTTITGWMVSILGFKFSIISIALPSVGIGLPLIFSKITKRKNLGEIFVGFGLLFLGLKFLKQSVPEVDSEILAFLSGYTQLGILSLLIFIAVGVILTIVVQSSSAAMTITITMAYSGWIDFPTACALVLGENIGTTITAYLASLNANYHAKRTARAHMIFNIAGVAWMIISFKYFIKFIDKILLDSHVPYSTDVYNSSPELFMNIPIHLSLFHTLFNIINVLLLIWFVPQIASIVERMVSPSEEEKEDDQYKLEYFSTGVQPVPEIAIIEVKKEVIKMSSKMIKMLNFFMETYKDRKNMTKSVSKAKKLEYLSDQMQEQISTYLAECTKHELSFESSKGAAAMMRIANELESVGDSTLNLFLQLERMEDGLKFDDRMNKEVLEIFNLVMKFIAWNHSFIKNDIQSMTEEHLYKSIEYEKEIDDIRNQFIDLSRERLSKGSNPKAELLFLDIVKHLEHIGDFSLNISQALEQLD
ncbi:MAG: Na/Pi cotransporter family protein [Candidatus Marinimicrobia bacterium]|nr:Na/Pi cotransporter family protein [Candidatus Neomarinimicrobiota bacterium]MDP6262079.1 Na/Pi cotransporter family protein [Candidatus Neomarinimicrobiota bacterium]MDP7128263.1 Na/Pi cotransporter family protein [Candidatus Neomarinimicrobiota bacterium]HJN68855.1 Na/Pi cotransporter family protein [Candidatus Neomarinimicrobiota bacterium]